MKLKKFLTIILALSAVLPLAARTVYVARHAQVGIGIKEISETRITEDLGVQQAKKLADYMVNKIKFTGTIYASPFYRTTETATYTGRFSVKKSFLNRACRKWHPIKNPRPKA